MTYGALTFDTQTVMSNSFDFDGGLLNQLKKLRHDTTQVIITDTVRSEILNHLTENTQQAISTLEGALKKSALYGLLDLAMPEDLKGKEQPRRIAVKRLRDYLHALNAETISSAKVQLTEVMRRYFSSLPPFSKAKKSEFPDAVSLLTLENWAIKSHLKILAISNDSDWKAFAKDSGYIDVVDTVNAALDKLNDQLHEVRLFAGDVLDKINANPKSPPGLQLADRIMEQLENLDIIAEGESYHQIEQADTVALALVEYELVDVEHFDLLEGGDDEQVVVAVAAEVTAVAETTFHLSIYDSIDRDYSSGGGVLVSKTVTLSVGLLVTINRGDPVRISRVEITHAPRAIHFGEIEPDFRNRHWDDEEEPPETENEPIRSDVI